MGPICRNPNLCQCPNNNSPRKDENQASVGRHPVTVGVAHEGLDTTIDQEELGIPSITDVDIICPHENYVVVAPAAT